MTGEANLELQALQNLGQRIVEAARLASAVHLFESLQHTSQHYGRRVGIGGAGPFTPGDTAEDSSARRTSRTAVVTDDPAAAHVSRAAGISRRPPQSFESAD
jgi:hypothetical protein